jgi:integrase/recombinase XerD
MDLAPAIDAFVEHLRVERGMASHTLKAYRSDLEHLWRYLSRDGTERLRLADLTPLYVKDFVAHLRDDCQMRPTSIARAMSSLRRFCDYCVQREWLDASPATGLRNPRLARKLPVYLVDDEIPRLLRDGLPDEETADRDRAILVTFLFTGVRLSELVGLDAGDVDMKGNCLRIWGKGSKERLVPMHEVVRLALAPLMASLPHDAPVFRQKDGSRMTARMVGYVVEKAIRQSGLSQRITPHKLRHTFATQLLHRGARLLEIKELLGHSRLATTSIYTHTHVDRLRRAVDEIDLATGTAPGAPDACRPERSPGGVS